MTSQADQLIDHLLDARGALRAAQDLSTEGAPIHKLMAGSTKYVDDALKIARATRKAMV